MTPDVTRTYPSSNVPPQRLTELLGQWVAMDRPSSQLQRQCQTEIGKDWTDRIAAAASLQIKARRKFGAGTWWVTSKSLQQATAWQVAQLKSNWLGDRLVYDLCCGVGGDAMQFAKRVPVIAVDIDPVIVEMTSANLATIATPDQASARCCPAADVVNHANRSADAAIHIDPDRRPGNRRTSTPDLYAPAWSEVQSIIANSNCAVIKLAPAAKPDFPSGPPPHQTWISLGGVVREQAILYRDAIQAAGMRAGSRSAIRVSNTGHWQSFEASADELDRTLDVADAPQPQEWLIDPDPAIRAAGLTAAFARRNSLRPLGGPAGFLTTTDDSLPPESLREMSIAAPVIWSGSCDDRKLRRELRSRGCYPQVIKCRGTDHNPATLTKRYRNTGEIPVTLWIGRSGGKVFAALTDPAVPRT